MIRRIAVLVAIVCSASVASAATLTVQTIASSGITPTYAAAAAGGDKCANDGRTYIEVKNSHAANAYTVTFDAQATSYGETITDRAVTVAAGTTVVRKMGPWPTAVFSDSSGYVNWTYTGTAPATDLTVGCFKVPQSE
jgi:hypothetical protein